MKPAPTHPAAAETVTPPAYSRCAGCDQPSPYCICGEEDEPTDSWRPMVAGQSQWPLVLLTALLLSGCKRDAAAAWMDRVPLWMVAITALVVGGGLVRMLGWAIAKPRGPRGLGLDVDHDGDAIWDARGPYGYQERPRDRLRPTAPSDDPLVSYVGSVGEAVMIPRSLAIKLSRQPARRNSPHHLGHEF